MSTEWLFSVPRPAAASPSGPQQEISDLAVGSAAEHLVCADLLLQGWRTFLTDQNCPYDVAVDLGGQLARVQVKSTRGAKRIPQRKSFIPAYQWHVRRAGKGGRRVYGDNEFDLLALVAVDIHRIAYLPPSNRAMTVHIRPPGAPIRGRAKKEGKEFDDFPFSRALTEWLEAA